MDYNITKTAHDPMEALFGPPLGLRELMEQRLRIQQYRLYSCDVTRTTLEPLHINFDEPIVGERRVSRSTIAHRRLRNRLARQSRARNR